MPASKLSGVPTSVSPFDVLVTEGNEPGLLAHAMLYVGQDRTDVTAATKLDTFHMGPPLETHISAAYACGRADLTAEQQLKIKTFLDERMSEKAALDSRRKILGKKRRDAEEYWLLPDALPPSREVSIWRFSCVGLVKKAYLQAGIKLLATNLPKRSLAELQRFYPGRSQQRILASPELRSTFLGLTGNGPWAVSLVGYVIHSLAREAALINPERGNAIPYKPRSQDSHFP